MKPGQRVEAIKDLTDRLSGERDFDLVDMYFDDFGISYPDQFEGSLAKYVQAVLRKADEASLIELYKHCFGAERAAELGTVAATSANSQVPDDSGREVFVFLSHLAREKKFANDLRSALEEFGIFSFVAHEDISPGEEWQKEIGRALGRCDALISIHHDGFRESDWTQQEVGWALGRGIPVISLRMGEDPTGFASAVQAIPSADWKGAEEYADEIVSVLKADPRTTARVSSAYLDGNIERLVQSPNFNSSIAIFKKLRRRIDDISEPQYRRILHARDSNRQVRQAWGLGDLIGPLAERYEPF